MPCVPHTAGSLMRCIFSRRRTSAVFVPMQYKVSIRKGKKVRTLVPVIRNLVFVHTTKQTACDLSNVYGVRLFYMKDLFTRSMLIVPDKQMTDFMFVMDLNPNGVSSITHPLQLAIGCGSSRAISVALKVK